MYLVMVLVTMVYQIILFVLLRNFPIFLGKEEITGADKEKYDKIINKFPQVVNDMIDNGLAALGNHKTGIFRKCRRPVDTNISNIK